MASVFCIGVPKTSSARYLTRLCKISKNHNAMQVAFMKRLSLCDPVLKRTTAFRYWESKFSVLHTITTSPLTWYDENTRLVVVDGPPAVGKTKVCEALAKEFGLLYMPAPVHNELYINPYGDDLRQLDEKLPLHCKSYDLERFLADPKDVRVPFFQIMYLVMRVEQYANAILHTLSTGQGVVLNRCIYSDIAFAEAMLKSGYISNEVKTEYMFMRKTAMDQLLRPHLIIYLDVPPELVKEKIRKRGNPHEVNSKVLTTKYLSDLENAYKEKYLKSLQVHSQLLMYDWSNEGNVMDVVSDVEAVDLDSYKKPKLADWIFNSVAEIHNAISKYQDKWHIIRDMYYGMTPPPRELYWTAEEFIKLEEVLDEFPSEKYDYGYNPKSDDKFFFEHKKPKLHVFRRTPRDFVNRDDSLFI